MSSPNLSGMLRIHEICNQFEEQWVSGNRPQLENYLTDVTDSERSVLLRELLVLELAFRLDQGERPTASEYRDRFPSQQQLVDQVIEKMTQPEDGSQDHSSNRQPRYTRVRIHAHGGLGRIWLARDNVLQRNVALKEIRPELEQQAEAQQRFVREAQITSQLEHPSIVPVYDLSGTNQPLPPYYAMRFLDNSTLRDAIRQYHIAPNRVALARLLTSLIKICEAVTYAHAQGIVHRDLKPDNVILGKFGEVYVVDWGLAKQLSGEPPQLDQEGVTESSGEDTDGSGLGTPAYMSPEQATGSARLDHRTDVYSLGAILFEILTGKAPAPSEFTNGNHPSQRPRQIDTSIPKPLDASCAKAMAGASDRRYDSASQLASDLELWLADEPVKAYREPWLAKLARWQRRHRAYSLSFSAVVTLLVVGLLVGNTLLGSANRQLAKEKEVAETSQIVAQRTILAYSQWILTTGEIVSPHQIPIRHHQLEQILSAFEQFIENRGLPIERQEEIELAHIYNFVTEIQTEIGTSLDALEASQRGLELNRQLVEKYPGDTVCLRVATRAKMFAARMYEQVGRLEDGLQMIDEAVSDGEKLVAESEGESSDLEILALSLGIQARLNLRDGDLVATLDFGKQAIAQNRELVKRHAHNSRYQSMLAKSLMHQAVAFFEIGKNETAIGLLQEAATLAKAYCDSFPRSARYRHELGAILTNLSVYLRNNGQSDEASEVMARANSVQRALSTEYPEETQFQLALALIYINLAKAKLYETRTKTGDGRSKKESREKRLDEMSALSNKAIRILDELCRRDPLHAQFHAYRMVSYGNFGSIKLMHGRLDEGAADLQISDELADQFEGQLSYRDALLVCRNRLSYSDVCRRRRQFDQQEKIVREALGLARRLTSQRPECIGARVEYGRCLNAMGNIQRRKRDHAAAIDFYRSSVDIFESLDSQGLLHKEHLRWLVSIYFALGNEYRKTEQRDQAKIYIRKANELYQSLQH